VSHERSLRPEVVLLLDWYWRQFADGAMMGCDDGNGIKTEYVLQMQKAINGPL